MREKGFTLIELLVVLSIISLLATIVLTNVNIARERAKTAKAKSEIKTLEQILYRYNIETGTWPNPEGGWNISTVPAWNAAWSDPYIAATIPPDPWGTAYFFDGGPTSGPWSECGFGMTGICSAGPNKTFNSWASQPNIPVGDDICVRMSICP